MSPWPGLDRWCDVSVSSSWMCRPWCSCSGLRSACGVDCLVIARIGCSLPRVTLVAGAVVLVSRGWPLVAWVGFGRILGVCMAVLGWIVRRAGLSRVRCGYNPPPPPVFMLPMWWWCGVCFLSRSRCWCGPSPHNLPIAFPPLSSLALPLAPPFPQGCSWQLGGGSKGLSIQSSAVEWALRPDTGSF